MMNAIFSIKPIYANAIMDGHKKYEYRKIKLSKTVDKVYVYSTAPVKKIIGHFTIKEIHEKHPIDLWLKTWDKGKIDIQDYQKYFKDKSIAYAYEIDQVTKYEEPIELKEIDGVGQVPQSFKYIH